jgi:hypothetical protein
MPGHPGMPGPQGMPAHPGMPGPQGMPGPSSGNPGHQMGEFGDCLFGYQQPWNFFNAPQDQQSHECTCHSSHGPGHPKHDAHKYGQFIGLVNDLANGKADPYQVMSYLDNLDTQFWKGALVGLAVTLLLTNNPIKKTIGETFSGIWGSSPKETGEK